MREAGFGGLEADEAAGIVWATPECAAIGTLGGEAIGTFGGDAIGTFGGDAIGTCGFFDGVV
jgi:outer membrane lipoprotein SlyB